MTLLPPPRDRIRTAIRAALSPNFEITSEGYDAAVEAVWLVVSPELIRIIGEREDYVRQVGERDERIRMLCEAFDRAAEKIGNLERRVYVMEREIRQKSSTGKRKT